MQMLYELTVFSSLALMAIVVAIFILATSLQGNAVRTSAEEEETYLARRREKLKELSEQLVDVVTGETSDTAEVSGKTVGEWSKELSKIDRGISKARRKGKVLTVKNIVMVPSCSLLLSVIGSGTAIVTTGIIPHITWGLSLLLIGFSLYWIYRNLRFIEDFSTSVDSSTMIQQSLERVVRQVSEQTPSMVKKAEESPADDIREIVEAILASLPPREARIVQLYYGIACNRLSMKDIATEFRMSENKVKEILVRAIRMSRHPSRSRKAKKFLDEIPISGDRDSRQQFIGDIFGV